MLSKRQHWARLDLAEPHLKASSGVAAVSVVSNNNLQSHLQASCSFTPFSEKSTNHLVLRKLFIKCRTVSL